MSGPQDSLALNTESHLDYDAKLSKHETHFLNGSIWAKFLETVNARISGGVSDDVLDKYTMDRLETIYYKKQPTDEEATERVKHIRKEACLHDNGSQSSARLQSGKPGNFNGEVPVPSEDGVGADISLSSTGGVQQYHRSGQDIIFAYQLHIVKHKGWRQKDVDINVYKPKAAFLNEDGGVVEEELVETYAATEEDVRVFDEMPVEVLSATGGDEPCICMVFNAVAIPQAKQAFVP